MQSKWMKILVVIVVLITIIIAYFVILNKVRNGRISKLRESVYVGIKDFDKHSTSKLKAWLNGIHDAEIGKGDYKTFVFKGDTYLLKNGEEA